MCSGRLARAEERIGQELALMELILMLMLLAWEVDVECACGE